MKKYIAIGHWAEDKNITSIAHSNPNMKSFRDDLGGNAFVPYVIITEKRFDEILNGADVFEEVKKMTSNYRKWNEITDYIGQCLDIMEEKMMNA